jgi:circadian clock protein KaiC
MRDNPVFTVADGLFWLSQQTEHNSIVRKLQIRKSRGQASVPGMHTLRITESGVQTFPRTFGLTGNEEKAKGERRLSMGNAELDEMLGGGIPEGDSVLIGGSSGTGKSLLGTGFIMEGLKQDEPGIVAMFEERPNEYSNRAAAFGFELETPQKEGKLKLLYIRPLDLSVDETVREIIDTVQEIGAKRLVIDSLAGFEMALAPAFRTDFRESLYRMIGALTRVGVTVISTVETQDLFTEFTLSSYAISFLSDDIIRLRHVSINGQLRKMIVVVKMRRSNHSNDMREFAITPEGLVIGERLTGYRGLTTGVPGPWNMKTDGVQESPNAM